VIVGVAGRPVSAREDVTTALYTAEAGRAVSIEVRRGTARRTLTLTAGQPPQGLGIDLLERAVGLTVAADGGRLVVRRVVPGSPAAERGLAAGDVVLGANGQRTADLAHLGREVLRSLDRGGLLLAVQRGRFVYNLSFPL
jgi:S1-C subfamily serine protease